MRRSALLKLFLCAFVLIVVSCEFVIRWKAVNRQTHLDNHRRTQIFEQEYQAEAAPTTTTQAPPPPTKPPQKKHPRFPHGAPVPTPLFINFPQTERQRRIVDAFKHAWENYKAYAWGHDELCPIRKGWVDWGGHSGWGSDKTGLGLTAIESLDTMWLMGLHDEFAYVLRWLRMNHTFEVDVEVGIFESTIRLLGGLLSAYELSGEPLLLDKAYDLGKKLMRTFENGMTIPFASVNLKTLFAQNPKWLSSTQSLSEVTTIQLEFKKLSHFTGERRFDDAAQNVMSVILRHIDTVPGHLYSIYISLRDGEPIPGTITLGARGDSFYEYLVKQWILTNRTDSRLLTAWKKIREGIVSQLLVQINSTHAFIAEGASSFGGDFHREFKMDHLVCFTPGMFLLGMHGATMSREADLKVAADIARVCAGMYKAFPTRLAPEIVRFFGNTYAMYPSPGAHHYILRPEALEAQFYMYRFTKDSVWAENGWSMFEAMERALKVPNGWAGIRDVMKKNPPYDHIDKMESFFLAETLKYAFLLAADREILSLDEWVFNTEAHPLRILPG